MISTGTKRRSVPRPLDEQVVVITGASSGIGRETTLQFARRGASVVLAARSAEALESLAEEVDALGGTALVVATDVGDWPQVQALADAAVGRFGRADSGVEVTTNLPATVNTPFYEVGAFDGLLRAGTSLFLRHRNQPPDDGRSNHNCPLPGTHRTHGPARVAFPRSRYSRIIGYHRSIAAASGAAAVILASRRRR